MTGQLSRADAPIRGEGRSVLRGFRSIVVGRLFAAFSMWMALLILAKLSDPRTVGIYALAQAFCVPVAEVAKAGLREIYTSDTTDRYRFGDYFGFRIIAILAALAVMIAFGLTQGSGVVLAVVVLYALIRCAELASDIFYALFQARERMELIGRSLCWLGPTSMLFLLIGYVLSGSLVVAVLGQLAASLAVLALYDIRMARGLADFSRGSDFAPRFAASALRQIGRHALPLAIATLLVMVTVYLPRLVVEDTLDLSALGFFSAITALAMAPNRLVNSLGVAVGVRLARQHAAGDAAAFLRLLLGMVATVAAIGGLGVAIVALYGDAILSVVYTADYGQHAELLVWATAAAVLRSVADVLKFGMIASRRFWTMCLQYGSVALVAAVASFLLIPRHGLTGAGIALVVIFAAHVIAVSVGLFRNLPRKSSSGAIR